MPAVGNVLIVGGGTAGSALAILLARAGVTVDIAEIQPATTALGSGITLQGNALRVLRDLGVWDRVAAAGFPFDSLGLRAPDGTLLAEIPDARTGGHDLPATLGPTGQDTMYAYLVEKARPRETLEDKVAHMRALAEGYGGAWDEIRVVEASLRLAEWQLHPAPDADVPGLMGRISALVTERP
ncbi:FAD-dependent monooxygenase [Microbispora sp. NPDC046933]|uniref:FAD-dependent monooxygenase n=1 Tax=Microbispora sp. NPDC046933 TaxID=3155618 RepID=UPI0033F39C4D